MIHLLIQSILSKRRSQQKIFPSTLKKTCPFWATSFLFSVEHFLFFGCTHCKSEKKKWVQLIRENLTHCIYLIVTGSDKSWLEFSWNCNYKLMTLSSIFMQQRRTWLLLMCGCLSLCDGGGGGWCLEAKYSYTGSTLLTSRLSQPWEYILEFLKQDWVENWV